MSYLRALAFYLGFYPGIILWSPLILLSAPLPYRYRYGLARVWARGALTWLRLTCGIRIHVSGREHIPRDQSFVVLSKHQSALETLYLVDLFSPQTWVLKRELLWLPFFGWSLGLLRPIAIDRSAGRKSMQQVMGAGRERLSQGINVVVYPEGTRVPPGYRARYGLGGPTLAIAAQVPVIPVAHNAGEHWAKGRFTKIPGEVHFQVGPPIDTSGLTPEQLRDKARDWIEPTCDRIGSTPRQSGLWDRRRGVISDSDRAPRQGS